MKKRAKFSKMATSTLMATAVTLGANLVANDLTPGSWDANAMSGKSEKTSEHQCGEGECGKKEKGADHQCGEGECGESKGEDKGSEGSCGENTCGH